MRIAIIEDGQVARVISAGENWQDIFPDVEGVASETANVGDAWDGAEFVAPPIPAPTIDELKAYAAARRWQVETGGILVEGIHVATDDRSKVLIAGARLAAQADPSFTTKWAALDGSVHELTAAQVIAISDAVLTHVKAAFATFAEVSSDIAAASITTFAQIDAADWPENA